MTTGRAILIASLFLASLVPTGGSASYAQGKGSKVEIGSKAFNESVILGEILTSLAREAGAEVDHTPGLGGTGVVWAALKSGEIDAYVDYTGTLLGETYATEKLSGVEALPARLERDGLAMTRGIGFENNYGLAMMEDTAERLGIETVSDLAAHPDLRPAFSSEFIEREDGWKGLKRVYGFTQQPAGMEHSVSYTALKSGSADFTVVYTTDAEIKQMNLRVLRDDRGFFPRYHAVIVYRLDLEQRAPEVVRAFKRLEGKIGAQVMIGMNAAVKIDKLAEAEVARSFVEKTLPQLESRAQGEAAMGDGALASDIRAAGPAGTGERIAASLGRIPWAALQHLYLVGVSLMAAIILALPLGVLAHRRPKLGQAVMAGTGLLQTIPSLALLVMLIPLLGIGANPAIAALFLYSLLPIVRNTHAGLSAITPGLIESAEALGLTRGQRLRLVELPLASRSILAGIKVAAVINIGTATLGGFIGAGGFGDAIFTGVRREDNIQILEGAVPAAVLALIAQGLFELAERRLVPKGLRVGGG